MKVSNLATFLCCPKQGSWKDKQQWMVGFSAQDTTGSGTGDDSEEMEECR